MKNILRLVSLLACLTLSGCVIAYVPGKLWYMAPAFGTKTFDEVDLAKGIVKGYKSEQAQMTEAISSGVAAGVTKGLAK